MKYLAESNETIVERHLQKSSYGLHYDPMVLLVLIFLKTLKITPNSERYGHMLSAYFWREIEDYNLKEMDGATGTAKLANYTLL